MNNRRLNYLLNSNALCIINLHLSLGNRCTRGNLVDVRGDAHATQAQTLAPITSHVTGGCTGTLWKMAELYE